MIPVGTWCRITDPADPRCGELCQVVGHVTELWWLPAGSHLFDAFDGRGQLLGHEWQVKVERAGKSRAVA